MADAQVAARSAGRAGRTLRRILALGYVGILVVVPIVVITWRTVAGGLVEFWSAISSPDAVTAIELTLGIALGAVVLNTVFGVGVALLIVRFDFPGRRLLNALVDLPMSVSPIVAGFALLLVYGPASGWLGRPLSAIGVQIVFSPPGMVLATAFASLPLVLREVAPVLIEAGDDQEQAASVLGANAWQRFLRITLPTIRPALLYGVVLCFARSIGEFGAVRVVSGNIGGAGQTQTVTLLIDQRLAQLESGYYQLAFLLIVVTVGVIATVTLLRDRQGKSTIGD